MSVRIKTQAGNYPHDRDYHYGHIVDGVMHKIAAGKIAEEYKGISP